MNKILMKNGPRLAWEAIGIRMGWYPRRGRDWDWDSALLFLAGVAMGALCMFILDPERGRRRQALARDRAQHVWRRSSRAAGSKSRHLRNRASGILAETRSILRRNTPDEFEGMPDIANGDFPLPNSMITITNGAEAGNDEPLSAPADELVERVSPLADQVQGSAIVVGGIIDRTEEVADEAQVVDSATGKTLNSTHTNRLEQATDNETF